MYSLGKGEAVGSIPTRGSKLMSEEKQAAQRMAEEMLDNLRRNVAADKKRRAEADEDEQSINGVCCQ